MFLASNAERQGCRRPLSFSIFETHFRIVLRQRAFGTDPSEWLRRVCSPASPDTSTARGEPAGCACAEPRAAFYLALYAAGVKKVYGIAPSVP
jgi:hypothetical protein